MKKNRTKFGYEESERFIAMVSALSSALAFTFDEAKAGRDLDRITREGLASDSDASVDDDQRSRITPMADTFASEPLRHFNLTWRAALERECVRVAELAVISGLVSACSVSIGGQPLDPAEAMASRKLRGVRGLYDKMVRDRPARNARALHPMPKGRPTGRDAPTSARSRNAESDSKRIAETKRQRSTAIAAKIGIATSEENLEEIEAAMSSDREYQRGLCNQLAAEDPKGRTPGTWGKRIRALARRKKLN